MRDKLGMKYKRVKRASIHCNSEKNLVLRQLFAIELFKLWSYDKVFLAVDESWLNTSDFRKMKWRPQYDTNSVPQLVIQPRISMILGVDTLGNTYMTLTQSNTNSSIMELYFRHLAKKLDHQR